MPVGTDNSVNYVGWKNWRGSFTADGGREFSFVAMFRGNVRDGPSNVLAKLATTFPISGYWQPPGSDDIDVYAFRSGDIPIEPMTDDDGNDCWGATLTYRTPGAGGDQSDTKYCRDGQSDNPLLQPDRISGTFGQDKEEATFDRYGLRVVNSAFEQIRGPMNEWDRSQPAVTIEQNVADLELDLLAALADCVNDDTMWGLPARTIKFKPGKWEVKYYGTCSKYYTRTLEFEVRYDGWDRDVLDEGTKALHGRWHPTEDRWELLNIAGAAPDPNNPQHFIRFKDRNAENTKCILNGAGIPISVDDIGTSTSSAANVTAGTIRIEKYNGANLFLLNIPTSI